MENNLVFNNFKDEYIRVISDIFPNESKKYQYAFCSNKYTVDLFLDELGIIVEIDNEFKEHEDEYYIGREVCIMKELCAMAKERDDCEKRKDFDYSQWFRIIHIKEGSLGVGIRQIMIAIEEIHWNTPVMYMK